MVDSLKSNDDFKNVYNNGKSYANKYLIMYIKENMLNRNRIGISVSKKVGNSVIRHRIKRLVRESYRLNNDNFNKGFDIVVISRVQAKDRSYKDINDAMIHLTKLHKVFLKRDE